MTLNRPLLVLVGVLVGAPGGVPAQIRPMHCTPVQNIPCYRFADVLMSATDPQSAEEASPGSENGEIADPVSPAADNAVPSRPPVTLSLPLQVQQIHPQQPRGQPQ